LPSEGLPHSEIPGSKPVCGSPRLIAACHVLHRFSAPRHPPSTLSSLTIKYLRRESFLLPDSLVKDRDHRGSKSPSPRCKELSHPRRLDQVIELRVRRLPSEVGGADRNTAGLYPALPTAGGLPPVAGSNRRSPSRLRHQSPEIGGADRNRTGDLRLAKPPLSQLSYSPT
jgi:hypothetical protein